MCDVRAKRSTGRELNQMPPLGRARDFPLAVLRRVRIHCERSVRVFREVVVAANGLPVDRIGDRVFRHSVYAALFIPAPDPQLSVITLSLCSLGSVIADDVIRRSW